MLALLLAAAVASPQTITLREVEQSNPAVLAKKLLPEIVHLTVVGGQIRRQFLPYRSYWLEWWDRPRASGGLCERTLHWITAADAPSSEEPVTAATNLTVSEADHRLQFALPGTRGCNTPSGYVSPLDGETAAAIEALRQLRDAVALAAIPGAIPFEVTCREDDDATEKKCGDARSALKALPLERLSGVQFDSGKRRQLEPGLYQTLPGTLADPETATFWFTWGGGDPLTWSAQLDVRQGKLSAVRLGRTYVHSH